MVLSHRKSYIIITFKKIVILSPCVDVFVQIIQQRTTEIIKESKNYI